MISRRSFLQTLSASALVLHPAFKVEASAPAASRIFVGTGGSGPGQGIVTAEWYSSTGEIGPITLAAEIGDPTFLAQYRRGHEMLIYVVTEEGGDKAKVSALTTVRKSTTLKLLNTHATLGDAPTHVSVSPDGCSVFVANYSGGSVSSYHVREDGWLSEVVSHFQFTGNGPNRDRQQKPHTHSAITSPNGRFVLVNDLGLDRIMVYRLNRATSEMTPCDPAFFTARPGSGPRHLAWNPNGRFVYCANELDSTIEVLAWDEAKTMLTAVGSVSSLPEGFAKNTAFVGEIVASTDGRNIYAGNRVANDSIAVFDVNRDTSLLKAVQFANGGGKNARHIALDPTQRWLLLAHQNSNDLVVLERDRKSGRLSAPRRTYTLNKPMCILFA